MLSEATLLYKDTINEYIALRTATTTESRDVDDTTTSSGSSVQQASSWTNHYSLLATLAVEGLATIAFVLDPARRNAFMLQVLDVPTHAYMQSLFPIITSLILIN